MMNAMIRPISMASHTQKVAFVSLFLAVTAVVMSFGVPTASPALASAKSSWFSGQLDNGEIRGYRWAVGVKIEKRAPLHRACALTSMVEPPREDVPYVEAEDASDCGGLSSPSDFIASTVFFGSGSGRVAILGLIFRPVVRRATFVLDTGERLRLGTLAPRIKNQSVRGIPRFRYLSVPFEGDYCVHRVMLFDERDKLVSSEARSFCS
jgi:hypothetical protein